MLNTIRIRDLDRDSKVVFRGCDNSDAIYKAFWDFQDASSKELELPKVPKSPRPAFRPTLQEAVPCPSNP